MNLQWRFRRLLSMSPAEIVWRFHRLGRQYYSRCFRTSLANHFARAVERGPLLTAMIKDVTFYGLSGLDPKAAPKAWGSSAVASAGKLLQHRHCLFGLGEINAGPAIRWNYEYKRNIELPLEFAPSMDYRDTGTYGDFKYFWELPRLQHLVLLSKTWYLTRENHYADEVKCQLLDFLNQSPFLLGVNWMMPMEVGIRLVSVSWIVAFLADYLENEPDLQRRLKEMVLSHTWYVTRNYAKYSSANNHLIGEAAGVFIAATCFPALPEMKNRQKEAYDILCKEIHLQHYSDGVNKEQGMHYQMFCFDFLVMAGLLGRANRTPFPEFYWQKLHKSALFMAAAAHEDGNWRHIGDSDDGHAIRFSEESSELKSLLALAAVLFDDCALAVSAGQFSEKAFWLLGPSAVVQFEEIKNSQKGNSKTLPVQFPEGGYYILKSPSLKIVLDCGPLGFGAIAAHGHADSLSFTLDVDGRPFLIDPGTYTYVASDPYRNYFRSTLAHNTVTVDGLDQSEMSGPFLWKTKADSTLIDCQSNEQIDSITAEHNGYQRLPNPVLHRRTITLDKTQQSIMVQDNLKVAGSHSVWLCFHLHPNYTAETIQGGFLLKSQDFDVQMQTDPRFEWTLYRGDERSCLGWTSQSYDRKEPAISLVGKMTIKKTETFTTLFGFVSQPVKS